MTREADSALADERYAGHPIRQCDLPAVRRGVAVVNIGCRAISRSGCRALIALLILAQPAGAATAQIEFEKFTLSNGLQVILHVDRKLPVVHVNQWFHVGSKDEQAGRTGFAHLFEHMMFQGSKNAPDEYFAYVGNAGANLMAGGVNGTTDADRTNYFATVPSASLEYLLWLEADRLATLPAALTQLKLDNQREVVRNERRQSFENQPYGRAFKLILENLYPAGHPYSWHVIGSHEDLNAASLEDVRAFFDIYYAPNNLSLAITGDFDPAQARVLVEKYFGGIAPGPVLERPRRWVPQLDGEKIIAASDRVPQARTYMAWPAPAFFEAGEAELKLASAILTDGLSSRLKKTLVYDRQLAVDVGSLHSSGEISGLFAVIVTARPGVSLTQLEQIVTDEIARLANEGPSAGELERVKARFEYEFVSALEGIGGFGGKADRLNSYNTYLGDPGRFEDDLARFRRAGADGVRDAVGRWLNTRSRLLVRFHPEASGRPSAVALDRSRPPSLGADKPFMAPEVKTARLENGLEIFVVERRALPKVAVTLTTRAGAVADPAGRDGLAQLTAATMDLGTTTRQALEIETALGDLGAALSGSAGREAAQLSLQVLTDHLSAAFSIFADVALNPAFPEAQIAREKKLHLDRLAQQAGNPGAVAARVGNMLLYGPDHPYGRPADGLQGTIESITRADIARFHAARWKPASSALIFAGDITLEQATALARRHFGSWPGGAAPVVTIPAPRPAGAGGVFVVDRQDAAQTHVAQLIPGPARAAQDYYAFSLANAVWGGGLQARLMLNLREDKGYSYGIYSFPTFHGEATAWGAAGGVQTDKTGESIAEINAELADIGGRRPVTAEELAQAKANRVRGYAQEFQTLGRVVGQISRLWELGLPMTELQRFTEQTRGVTLAAANQAMQIYAVPGKATLLLVGDYVKIADGLSELGLQITLLDTEGKTIPDGASATTR